jgi:hypothetical protein
MGRPSLKSAADPANTASPATQPTARPNILTSLIFFLLHPLTIGTQQSAPFHPHHLHLFPAAGQPNRTAPGRSTGRPRQPGGPHVEGRCVRVGVAIDHGVGNDPITPTPRAPEAWLEWRPRAPPAQPGERPGALGANHPGLPAASLQKGARQANRGRQATNPIGVFSSSSPLFALGEKGKGTTPRRAGERRTRGSRERGAGAEEDNRRCGYLPGLRTPLHRAGHDYTAAPP